MFSVERLIYRLEKKQVRKTSDRIYFCSTMKGIEIWEFRMILHIDCVLTYVTETSDRSLNALPEVEEFAEWVYRLGLAPIATIPVCLQCEICPEAVCRALFSQNAYEPSFNEHTKTFPKLG